MSRRMWVLAVASWVGVVIAGSALTWLAINRAGDQVSSSADTESTQPVVIGSVDTPPSLVPSRKPSPKPSPSPTARPSARATAGAGHGPTAAPQPTQRPAAPSPKVAPPSRTQTGTWTGTAGFLTVSCTGQVAHLQAASPSNGWSVERGDEAGDHVEVKFARNGVEVQVQALCVGGAPQFHAETSGDRSSESAGG